MLLSDLSDLSDLICTKANSQPISEDDGLRIFIARHTMNVGNNRYDLHIQSLAPSDELSNLWKHRKITWKVFYEKYLEEMRTIPKAQNEITKLRELINQGQKITLLCFESEWRHDCHRHILKEIILETTRKSKPETHYNMANAELISYVPKQKNKEKQVILESELKKITQQIPKKCYYCSDSFISKDHYLKHIITKHNRKLAYPGISDLKILGIQAQGYPWEI